MEGEDGRERMEGEDPAISSLSSSAVNKAR